MATILEFDEQAAGSLATALGSHSVVMTDAADVITQVASSGDSLVVIGPSVSEEVATRLTKAVTDAFPAGGVIWCRRRVDTTVVLAAVRAGAADVVAEADLPALVHAGNRIVERASHMAATTARESAQRARVTAVYSAKGGCGKTSIATNLAAMIASEQEQRVCLMDLDLESGDVQLVSALPAGRSILDLVELEATLDSISLTACMQKHDSGMYVLPAPRRPEEAAQIKPSLVQRVLEVACTMFDHVVIDCPPYATEHVLAVLDATDNLGLICTPDAASVKNTAIALEVFEELKLRTEVELIVNHAGDRVGITSSDIQEALQKEVSYEVPSSLEMPIATNSAQLLALSKPESSISQALRKWAHHLSPPPPPPLPAQRTESAKSRRVGFFRRRVSTS